MRPGDEVVAAHVHPDVPPEDVIHGIVVGPYPDDDDEPQVWVAWLSQYGPRQAPDVAVEYECDLRVIEQTVESLG